MKFGIYFFLFFFICSNITININNGDPFHYINSRIKKINHYDEFMSILEQENVVIVIISYHNNFYGTSEKEFSEMAAIYEDLKKQFSGNQKVAFYRVHMTSGIHSCLLEDKSPSVQIYYNKMKLNSLSGKKLKKDLVKFIMSTLQSLAV
jgi:hypothetical protein